MSRQDKKLDVLDRVERKYKAVVASIRKEGTKRQISELADLMYTIIVHILPNVISREQLVQEMAKRQK